MVKGVNRVTDNLIIIFTVTHKHHRCHHHSLAILILLLPKYFFTPFVQNIRSATLDHLEYYGYSLGRLTTKDILMENGRAIPHGEFIRKYGINLKLRKHALT
jgi:hypothetical protein